MRETDEAILRATYKSAEAEYYHALNVLERASADFSQAKEKKRVLMRAVDRLLREKPQADCCNSSSSDPAEKAFL